MQILPALDRKPAAEASLPSLRIHIHPAALGKGKQMRQKTGITIVRVLVMSDGDVTVVTARYGDISVAASAKRDPADKVDLNIGVELATARALIKLGRRLQRRADGDVRNADWLRREKLREHPRYTDLTKKGKRPSRRRNATAP